jgi:hemerythrin-like domain-containing protein
MKRSPALVTLSHDHHRALSVAQKLRRATADSAGDAQAAFVAYWDAHGRRHFRLEEEILLPAYASHGDSHHSLVARALCDHVAIRARADALLVDEAPDPAVLHELGTCLADHVRLEERELFPLIEAALPAARLAAVATALDRAERLADQGAPARRLVDRRVGPGT